MLKVTQKQALHRWDTLPMPLREALASFEISELAQKICRGEHLPEQNIPYVLRTSGYVFMGFLKPEEMAGELKELMPGVPAQVIDKISDHMKGQIFAQFTADIAKVYALPGEEAPEPVAEIKKPEEANWLSRISAMPSTVKPSVSVSAGPIKAPPGNMSIPPAFRPSVPAGGAGPTLMKDLSRVNLSALGGSPAGIAKPAIPPPPVSGAGTPAPMLIQKRAEVQPVENKSGLRLDFWRNNASPTVGTPPPPPSKPARLEIGMRTEKKPAGPVSTPLPPSRPVNYSAGPERPSAAGAGSGGPMPFMNLPSSGTAAPFRPPAPPPPGPGKPAVPSGLPPVPKPPVPPGSTASSPPKPPPFKPLRAVSGVAAPPPPPPAPKGFVSGLLQKLAKDVPPPAAKIVNYAAPAPAAASAPPVPSKPGAVPAAPPPPPALKK